MYAALDRGQYQIGRLLDFALSGFYLFSIQPGVSSMAIRGQENLHIKRFGASRELDFYLVLAGAVLIRAVAGRGRVAHRHFSRRNICGLPSRRKLGPAESGALGLHAGISLKERVDHGTGPSIGDSR